MANDDWALVLGISHYPDMGDFAGADDDAHAFSKWLLSPTGGAVPGEQLFTICSADVISIEGRPNASDVENVIARIINSIHVGRRLYMYMSGLGYLTSFDEPALLMANATTQLTSQHIPGKLLAQWFLQSAYFSEVVLFMDCSWELFPFAPPRVVPFVSRIPKEKTRSKFFCALSTAPRQSRRIRRRPGTYGVLTTALLAGLNGAASGPDKKITASSLADFLFLSTKTFLSEDELKDPDIPKEPRIIYDGGEDIVFLELGEVPSYAVHLNLPAESEGKVVEILDGRLQAVAELRAPSSPKIDLHLTRGLYLARIPELDRRTVFEVTGVGGVDVAL